jgi:shikimate kinase
VTRGMPMTIATHRPANIILCGFMGVGKTTVGRLVAARLGWAFVDTDDVIAARAGKPIPTIFAEEGEAAFRALERDLCVEIASWRRTVVATGGGMVLDPANRAALMRAGLVVCLHAPADELARRLARKTDRPLLAGHDHDLPTRIEELLAARAEAYAALPHQVESAGRCPEAIAAAIITLWRQER